MADQIAILVDSGTDVPDSYLKKYENIFIVPLRVIYPEGEYEDRIQISSEEIFARMPWEVPKTSLPDGGQITDAFHPDSRAHLTCFVWPVWIILN